MKKIIGWILLTAGSLIALGCVGVVVYVIAIFIPNLDNYEAEVAFQLVLIAVFIGIIIVSIPASLLFYFGWKLSHPIFRSSTNQIYDSERNYDNSERILAVIETLNDKALYFTEDMIIVAHIDGLGKDNYTGSIFDIIAGILGTLVKKLASDKAQRLRELTPEQIVADHSKNFIILYDDVIKLSLYKKFFNRRMMIVTKKPIETYKIKPCLSGYAIEFELNRSRQLDTNLNAILATLPDKMQI